MQYEQTTAHMEDSSNQSSICFKCHPEHTCFGMGYPNAKIVNISHRDVWVVSHRNVWVGTYF